MEHIPILRMGEFLLVTIQVDMHDQLALKLQDDLSNAIQKNASKGVLIDISTLEMVDSFIGRMVADISGMGRILGAETVLVGMQPAVAITLVELGLALPGVATALNVERGMALLRRKIDGAGSDADSHHRVRRHCAPSTTSCSRGRRCESSRSSSDSPWSIRPRWSPRPASWRAMR